MIEIERKWVIDSVGPGFFQRDFDNILNINLTYFHTSPAWVYRLTHTVSRKWTSYKLTRKTNHFGISRIEEDQELAGWAYKIIMEKFNLNIDIQKTRYRWRENGWNMELDIYNRPTDFPMVLEIEAPELTSKTNVLMPEGFIVNREVTDDPDFYGPTIALLATVQNP